MASVIDGTQKWPCFLLSQTTNNVVVTMAGNNGFIAVCSGPSRQGSVLTDDGVNQIPVTLPGAPQLVVLTVEFDRLPAS